jgi:transcriptional regulator with XRE-family HTH domain
MGMKKEANKTLAQWMAENSVTLDAVAKKTKTTSATVSRWRSGKAIPRKNAMAIIASITGQQVDATSFYVIQTPRATSPARGQGAAAPLRSAAPTKSPV